MVWKNRLYYTRVESGTWKQDPLSQLAPDKQRNFCDEFFNTFNLITNTTRRSFPKKIRKMDDDSDIQMVDAPESSPRPAERHLSGLSTKHSTSIFAKWLNNYHRVNKTTSGSLLGSKNHMPSRRASGFTPPSKLARTHQTITIPAPRGPNYFNTPKGSTASFKNPRIRALPFLPQNTPRRLSPSQYRLPWKSRQREPDPYSIEKTGNPHIDIPMLHKKHRLERAAARLSPEDRLKLNAKRSAEESQESASKRARIIETQGVAVPLTPVQSPVPRMPGAFPESPEHDAPVEIQPLSLPIAQNAARNIALAGISIYVRVRRITGVVKGAHRALKQGIRASTQFATAVGQRIRATHEPVPTIVAGRQDTQQTDESATSSASDQLQNDLTAYAGALPPRHHAIPVIDPSAQLQAELVNYASHIPQPSTIITAPAPTTMSANLLAQDQSSVDEIMSEASAALSEQPTTTATTTAGVEVPAATTTTVQSTSTSVEVESSVEDEDPDARKLRELFSRRREQLGLPPSERLLYSQGPRSRTFRRPAPVTPSETSTDAEVNNTELAQDIEEQTQDISSASTEHPTVETQDTAHVEEQQDEEAQDEEQQAEDALDEEQNVEDALDEEQHIEDAQDEEQQLEEQAEEQVTDEHEFVMSPDPPDNDDEYDPDAYYPGVPPLMPEMRFFFNAEFRRKVAAKKKAERRAALPRKSLDEAETPKREYLAALKEFEVAKAEQTQYSLRSILKRRHEDHQNRRYPGRHVDAIIQETVDQLAATTVRDEVPETPRPARNVHWDDVEINFGDVPSKCRWYGLMSPPGVFREGPEPGDRAGFEKYEEDIRRREKEWELKQQRQIVKEREDALGRADAPVEGAVRPLSSLWDQRLTVAMRSHPKDVLAKTSDADLTHEKLETCWSTLAWLNDEVINGHLSHTVKYLRRRANNLGANDAPKYYAFNSFFYKNLRDGGYQKVSRWARRGKIGGSALLNVETVFIPVHEGMHWTLLVVSPRLRTIEYFDSLGGNPDSFVENTRQWLRGELGDAYVESEWLFLKTPSPQQDNGSDCGVFLLTSAKAIALGLKPTVYGPKDIELIRKKIVAELINGGFHGELDPRDSSGVVQL